MLPLRELLSCQLTLQLPKHDQQRSVQDLAVVSASSNANHFGESQSLSTTTQMAVWPPFCFRQAHNAVCRHMVPSLLGHRQRHKLASWMGLRALISLTQHNL